MTSMDGWSSGESRSDSPHPRRSTMINRQKVLSFLRKWAYEGHSQFQIRFDAKPGTNREIRRAVADVW